MPKINDISELSTLIDHDGRSVANVLAGVEPRTVLPVTITSGAEASALTGTTPGGIAPVAGQEISFVIPATNTGAVTLALNGGAARAVTNGDAAALTAGALKSGRVYRGRTTAGGNFQSTASLPAVTAQVESRASEAGFVDPKRLWEVLDKVTSTVTITSLATDTMTGTTASGLGILPGGVIRFQKDVTDNTGAVTLNIDGTGAKSLRTDSGATLSAGQLLASTVHLAVLSAAGSDYILVGALPATDAQAGSSTSTGKFVDGKRLQGQLVPALTKARYATTIKVLREWRVSDTTRRVALSKGHVRSDNNGTLYKINAIEADLTTNQAIMVDLDGAVDGSGYLTPYVGAPNSGAFAGWSTGNKLVLFWVANAQAGNATLQISGGPHVYGDGRRSANMRDMFFANTGTNIFSVFVPSSVGGYRWQEFRIGLVTGGAVAGFASDGTVWKVNGIYDSILSHDLAATTRQQQLIRTSVSSFAAKTAGAGGFVGSTDHGNQVTFEALMWIDGKLVSPTGALQSYPFQKFEFYQGSKLYRYGQTIGAGWNAGQELGTLYERWTIEDGVFTQDITFVAAAAFTVGSPLTFDNLYMGMCPWHRQTTGQSGNADVDGVTAGLRTPGRGIEDLSTSGYAPVISNAFKMEGWGAGGYRFSHELLNPWDWPNRQARFEPSVENKPYIDLAPGISLVSGAIIHARTRNIIHMPY